MELVRLQVARQTGIFACEDYSVFTHANKSVQLCSAEDGSMLMSEALPAAPSRVGSLSIPGQTTNSWLNAETFMQAWDKITTEGRYRRHQWVAKVDPDSVFLPERLRAQLRGLALPFFGNFYVLNCDMWGRRMFGALEVYSRGAIEAYAAGKGKCKKLKWQGWGEDYYMQHCMDALGVKHATDYKMISDFNGHCTHEPPSACGQGRQAAFHPLKLPDAYKTCLDQVVRQGAAD